MKRPNEATGPSALSKHVKKDAMFIGLTFLVNGSLALLFLAQGGRWHTPVGIAFAAFGVSLLLPGVESAPQMQGTFERFESALTPAQIQQIKEQIAKTSINALLDHER